MPLDVFLMQGMREAKKKCGAGSFSRARFPERQSCHSKEEEEILFTKYSCSQLFPNSEVMIQGCFQFMMCLETKVSLGRSVTRMNIHQVALMTGLLLSR